MNFGSEQSFTLSVRGTNQQPTLKSSLPSEWKAGLPFDAKVDVVDPEGHALRFSELEPIPQGDPLPAGLVIGPDGRLTWPAPIEGEISFVVRATETHDPSSSFEATFKLTVLPATANLAPMVKAAPARSCATWTDGGYENRYTIVVTDPDASSGLLDFQIVGGASGDMAIIPGSTPGEAIVTWTPTQAELGTHQITVQATDFGGAGKPVYRSFILEALKNELPAIPADQVATVAVGDRLVHRVPASDPEQGGLKFAIDVSALNDSATLVAAGLSIDSITGQLLWAVPAHAALIGDYVVTVMATDALGAATKQEVQVKVTSDDVAPTIRLLMIDPATDAPVANGGKLIRNNQPGSNDDYQLSIRLTDNFGLGALNPQEHKLTVTPASGAPFQVPLPAFRSDFGLEALEVGPMTLEVTATDAAGIERVETYRFFIIDAASDAVAMIASPAGAEPVTTITKIYGSVDQDGSDAGTSTSYYIDVIDARIGEVVGRIADTTVASEVANGELATLDPTLFPDGTYRIRLAVVDSGGAILAIDEQRVEIVNSIKLGELDVAFTDLSVKLGGIPVTLSRSYDSKRAEEVGDFGYGWNLDFLDGAVVVDHPEGYASSLTQPTPIGTRILVTLADGSTHGFTFQMSGGGLFGGGKPVFTPDAGVTSRLSLSELQPHLSLELSWGHSDGTVKDNDGDAFVPAWWARDLQLSTRGGLNYHYSFETGKLVGLSDSNGNRIVIGPATDASGDPQTQVIETESGSQKILIHRDATTGLITEIVDPNQASIHYRYGVYDPVADEFSTDAELSSPTHQLGEVENRVAAKTHYLYDQIVTSGGESLDNMLVGVIDGDRPILTAGYNSEGRLNLLQDAAGGGADVEFDLNLGDGRSVERIKDSEGNFIDLVRDERGNVVMRVIPLDAPGAQPDPALRAFLVTESVFNENGNLLRESVPYRVVGAEQRYQVPAPLPETHPEAWARRLKYDDFNRLTHSTDALDNVTVTRYDDQDRVIASIDANGVINHSVYDERTGDLLERYSTQGESGAAFNRTRYSYENGRLVESHQVAADGTVNLVSTTAYFDSGDHLGLAKSTTDAAGVTRYFGYDDNGNQTHSWHVWTNPLPPSQSITLVTVSQYDGEGRAQATFEYELNAAYVEFFALKTALVGATSKSSTSTAYDSQGRVILATDRLGAVSHTLYDARGSVIESRSTAKNENNVSGWLVSRTLYDAQGQVVFAADPYFVTAAAYSATGVPTRGTHTVYDHLGRTTASRRYAGVQIDVDSSGTAPTTVTSFDFDVSPPLSVTSTHYDSLGRVEYTISESGARTDYYYDATGRQIAVLAPAVMIGGQTVRHLSESMFDPAGRLVQSKSNIAITASADAHPLIYDATFDPSLRDDSARQTAYYEYDPAGRQTAVITSAIDNPDTGSPQQSQFDIDHPRIHLRTETAYDDFGRRIVSIEGIKQAAPSDPDTINRGRQLATNYEYDQSGNLTAVVLPSIEHPDQPIGEVRPRYEYDYDDYGNRISIRDNVYQIGENIYYDHGGAANDFTAAYDTRLTEFDYDHRGRQVSRQLPEGVAAGNASFTERMVFSDTPLGSLGATPQASVGLGQLKYAVDFEGRVTAYFYDNTAAGGGRLVRKDYFESETLYNGGAVVDRVSYVYDAFGRTLTTTQQFALNDPPNARTRVTTNVYDAESRLTRITTPEGTINHEYHPVTGLPTRTYTGATSDAAYTSVQGDLKAITDTRYAYDKLGRLLHVVSVERFDTPLAGTSAPTSTVDWVDFNGNGVFAGNERVTGEVTSYAYDVVGNLSRISLPNNVTVDHEYDELNRLVRMINYVDASTGGVQDEFDAADLLRSSFEYELDVHHKRTSAVEKINHGNANNTTVVETHIDWVYDNLGRLASEDYDHDVSVTGGVDFLAEYAFDLVGNRLSKTVDNRAAAGVDEAFAYDYDRNDRLYRERQDANVATAPGYDTTTFYQYDSPNGAGGTMDGTVRTAETKYAGERTAPGTTKLSETTFQYDLRGRMKASSVDADGSQSNPAVGSEYAYNDAGIRISQKVGGVTTHYVVDDNNPTGYAQVLEEKRDVNQDGTIQDAEVTKSYIIGHDVIAQAAQAAAAMFLMTDGHGSTRALLDKMAAIVENAAANNQKQLFSYDAYGNLIVAPALVQQVQSALTSLLYSGEQTDMATGLQYLRARYYSAGTGTFNQFDAFNGITADPQSLHKYTYTEADPINGLDPTGQLGIFAAFVALSVFSLLFELVAGFALNYSSDILINSDPIYSDPINSTGLWSGGIGGVSASYGFSGGEVKAGTVWSFENSSQSVGIAYLGGSLGLGVGFSGGGAAVFIFNAPSVRNIPKALSVNLDVRVDAIGGLSSMLKRLFGAAFTARELSRISNGLAKTHEIAAVAEGIQDVLDISNFEPTYVTIPIDFGIQAFIGAQFGTFAVTDANL